jgi:hypothetical protein
MSQSQFSMEISGCAGSALSGNQHYDKTKTSYAAFLAIAAARMWLPYFVNRS